MHSNRIIIPTHICLDLLNVMLRFHLASPRQRPSARDIFDT